MVVRAWCLYALLVHVLVMSFSIQGSGATSVLIVNRKTEAVKLFAPEKSTVGPSSTKRVVVQEQGKVKVDKARKLTFDVPSGVFGVVILTESDPQGVMLDTNDLQLGLSAGAHACSASEAQDSWMPCVAKNTLGGLPLDFVKETFSRLWMNFEYWKLCEATDSAPSLRNMVAAGLSVDVLHEEPLIVAARGFLSKEEGGELMDYANLDSLTKAHVGSGGGATSTSESRETLTANLFVDWGKDDVLSQSSVKMYDLVSDLLKTEVPYEGQEPVNFLHYLRGFEYKPHMDGGGESLGKRVATTLLYCRSATEGGATVFPTLKLKFAPRSGDLLFFQYQPQPQLALHAACPVVAGNKTTLTQWHRLGVSAEKPWDNFEDWGKFHNPHGTTRWKGPRYGQTVGKEL